MNELTSAHYDHWGVSVNMAASFLYICQLCHQEVKGKIPSCLVFTFSSVSTTAASPLPTHLCFPAVRLCWDKCVYSGIRVWTGVFVPSLSLVWCPLRRTKCGKVFPVCPGWLQARGLGEQEWTSVNLWSLKSNSWLHDIKHTAQTKLMLINYNCLLT